MVLTDGQVRREIEEVEEQGLEDYALFGDELTREILGFAEDEGVGEEAVLLELSKSLESTDRFQKHKAYFAFWASSLAEFFDDILACAA